MNKNSLSGALSKRIETHTADINQAYNEMFGLSDKRDNIVSVEIQSLIPHEKDPFKPYSEENLKELAISIDKIGLLEPILVRPISNGKYEILSGKNRTNATKRNGKNKIDAIIKNVDDEQAIMIITEANLKHREQLCASEKAWAYRLQLEAISRQGKRTDLQLTVCNELKTSRRIVAEMNEVKDSEIQRYIRLTFLIRELIEKIDENIIPMGSGVSLSYLDEAAQSVVLYYLKAMDFQKKVSNKIADAIKLVYNENNCLTIDQVRDIFEENGKSKTKKFSISRKKLEPFINKIPDDEMLENLFLEFLKQRFLERADN